jgi:4-hydroxy-tetrahydrodipicolinate synthase
MMVAALTPFDGSDRLNLAAIRAHTRFLVDSGVAGLCPVGTTGEMLYLGVGQKVRLIEETCAAANAEAPVIAGIWALNAKEISLLGRAARAAGATAAFLPPPIYYPADDEVIYRHYAAAREAAELPIFAYNIPSYAANAISFDCVERMVRDGVIAGIKDSTGNAEQMRGLVERFAGRIAVEAASDSFAVQAKRLGAHGFISALANIWPASLVNLWNGDESVQPLLDEARNAVKKAGGIPALKRLAQRRGFDMGNSRLPHSDLSPAQMASLDSLFNSLAERGLA